MKQKAKNVSPFSNEARNQYVVEHITNAVLNLLQEKSLDDISISEICDSAAVSRTSFYRNFESKEDVVKRYVEKLIRPWEEEYTESRGENNAQVYGSLFKHIKDNSDFYLLLKKRDLMHLFLHVFLSMNGAQSEDPNMWAYTKSFIAYGTYGWIEEWIARGMQESAETMANLLSKNGMK